MTDKDLREPVLDYIVRLSGDNSENAWHSLVELSSGALPFIREAYHAAADDRTREFLIQALAEQRDKQSLELLQEASVWKAALDAIVFIGGSAAADLLRETEADVSSERRVWIREALSQILWMTIMLPNRFLR